jgi:hypothetical protein
MRVLINVFLLFHLIAIVSWSMPLSSPLLEAFRGLIKPYMLWSGLFQSWDTFAPTPKSQNDYIQGVVITRDGHTHNWPFPRMEQLGFLDRYTKERYRKFTEYLPDDKNSALRPDVAMHLAGFYQDRNNPPEFVILVRYWSDIEPHAGSSNSGEPERGRIFFEYTVTPADLK